MRANRTENMAGPDCRLVAVIGWAGPIAMTRAPDGGVSPALSAPELLAAVPGLNGNGPKCARSGRGRNDVLAATNNLPRSPVLVPQCSSKALRSWMAKSQTRSYHSGTSGRSRLVAEARR